MPTVPGLHSPLTAAAYGERHGIHPALVVAAIRDGVLPGARHGRIWYADDVPPPAALVDQPAATPAPEAPSERGPVVVRYTSEPYVTVLMVILAALTAVDVLSFVITRESRALHGVGTRVFTLWALWTRHRWARGGVYLWASVLVVGSAAGLAMSWPAGLGLLTPGGFQSLVFAALLACGLFYLATVHRVIRTEPEREATTLEDIAREARLD